MKNLKQNSGSLNCVEICANMITDAAPNEFKLLMYGKKPPYSDHDLSRFLFAKGFQLTVGVPGEAIQPMVNVGDSMGEDEYIPSGAPITEDTEIMMKFRVGDFPAYVVVETENDPEKEHAIYWDGKQIHDPNPQVGERTLNDYVIKRWFTIIKNPEQKPPEEKSRLIKL